LALALTIALENTQIPLGPMTVRTSNAREAI
jgi:hypothetical protein